MNRNHILTGLCVFLSTSVSACVSTDSTKETDVEPVSSKPVQPAQISPEECVNYVQLKRDDDYLCELTDGSTRPLKPGERRTTPLSRDEIEDVFRRNNADSLECFAQHLPKDAKLDGKIYVSFEIESDGKVSQAVHNESKSTYKNPKLAACLVDKVKAWRFPVLRTDETMRINFPFQLISSDPVPPPGSEPGQAPSPK